jgi:hypothetical protein
MKRFRGIKILIVVVMLIVMICSCSNNTIRDSSFNKTSPTENINQIENIQTKKISGTQGHSTPKPVNEIKNNINKEFESYLNTKKSDAAKLSKSGDSGDTVAIMESHMVFPCIFVEDIGITFIFPSMADDSLPRYLTVSSDTNKTNIDVKGAKPGMNFADIKKNLGDEKVKKTWISTEDDTAYELDYNINGIKYSFVSYEEDGKSSELYISKAEK